MSFFMDELSALKTLDHEYIDMIIERRKTWRANTRHRWSSLATASVPLMRSTIKPAIPHTIVGRRWREITTETETNLHNLADMLISSTVDFKFVTSIDQGWIYTNSKNLINQLASISELSDKEYKEVQINRPKNTIKLKNPQHTHRSYFKLSKLSDTEKTNLVNFFINQKDYIRLSPSLAKWIIAPFKRTQDYFFIDYTGEEWLIMLALIKSNIVRKTSVIIPA